MSAISHVRVGEKEGGQKFTPREIFFSILSFREFRKYHSCFIEDQIVAIGHFLLLQEENVCIVPKMLRYVTTDGLLRFL